MSGGALMELVAYGAQDVYLTGNSQVTFFKQLYKRHTNFAMQSVEAGFNGSVGFGKRVSLVVPRVGDLMGKVYLQVTIPELTTDDAPTSTISWVNELGHFLINNIEVQIGGQAIDKHYGTWLSIWNNLSIEAGKTEGYNSMIGNPLAAADPSGVQPEYELYIPLQFWFNKHHGLALPLIALQYHEVRFTVEFETFANLVGPIVGGAGVVVVPELDTARLYIDYIFLDTQERRKFAQVSHEYLIDQLQFTGDESLPNGNFGVKLNFNHPVKELIWVCLSGDRTGNSYGDADGVNPVSIAKLQFNGHDRFSARFGRYFSEVQPYQHHTNIPSNPGINVYSFALYPELEQPSGTANFSRIDNSTLSITLTDAAKLESSPYAKIYAVNYNVLRIMSGMGGLAYSN